jgi:hypothetical protein
MDYDPTAPATKFHTGKDGITRKWILEVNTELCKGYGGGAYNGVSWAAFSQDSIKVLLDTVELRNPTMPQVILYEVGRCTYNLNLDKVLDWQMQEPSQYGYWTLGWNGAMTVLGPAYMDCNMDYYGVNAAEFRTARLRDLSTYIGNSSYTFENTWSKYLLPWNSRQSVNDLMSGLLIYLNYNYGSAPFLYSMFKYLNQQPDTYSMTQREKKATNFARACYLAAKDVKGDAEANALHLYFYNTLRWRFIGSSPNALLTNM